jgi:cytochrome c oxidase assembly factor CtaG
VWRAITNPLAAWLIHAVALWVWHIPVLFEAVLEREWVHTLQHLSFFLSALLFWWALIHGRERALGYGAAVLFLFTTALHSGLLGALITFAPNVWYPGYLKTTQTWGLTPLEDQQLGGLIMWIPAGLVYVVAGLALFAGWLRESEARVLKHEQRAALLKG